MRRRTKDAQGQQRIAPDSQQLIIVLAQPRIARDSRKIDQDSRRIGQVLRPIIVRERRRIMPAGRMCRVREIQTMDRDLLRIEVQPRRVREMKTTVPPTRVAKLLRDRERLKTTIHRRGRMPLKKIVREQRTTIGTCPDRLQRVRMRTGQNLAVQRMRPKETRDPKTRVPRKGARRSLWRLRTDPTRLRTGLTRLRRGRRRITVRPTRRPRPSLPHLRRTVTRWLLLRPGRLLPLDRKPATSQLRGKHGLLSSPDKRLRQRDLRNVHSANQSRRNRAATRRKTLITRTRTNRSSVETELIGQPLDGWPFFVSSLRQLSSDLRLQLVGCKPRSR